MLKTALTVVACLSMASVALAGTPTIDAGTHALQPNLAGQTIQIYVTGGALVQGLEFNVQLGDGGGPVLENVDVLTGTIFGPSNDGIFPGSYITPHLAYQGTTTVETRDVGYGTGYVSTDGLLATLTVDTTGIFDGEFALDLIGTDEGDTNFAGVFANVTNGMVTVPEPLSITVLVAGSTLLLRRRKRS